MVEKLKNKVATILRWSEKYTKTDMVYLVGGGFWMAIGQISVSLMIFLLAIAFAYFVPKEIYGQYKYVLSIAGVLGAFTLSGLNMAVLQSVSRGYEGSLMCAFWKNIKWSALFFLGAIIVSLYYFINDNTGLGISVLIAGCLWPFFTSTNLYSPYLVAKKDFRRSAVYFDVMGNLLPSVCLFATMLITSNIIFLVTTYIVSNLAIGIILYLRVLKIYKPAKEVDPEMMVYGKHLSFINIFNIVANNIDQILVFHYVGAIQLAIYNFAVAIPNQIKGPVKNLVNLIFPKFTERSDAEIRSGMKNKFLLLFIASLCFIAAYILISPYIFRIFFPKYIDSIFYSQIFSLSILWMISVPADAYLASRKKVRELYISSISMSALQIAVIFTGVVLGGLMGLVIARVIMRLLYSTMSILLYNKASKESLINGN